MTATTTHDLLLRLETFYDAVPRAAARCEDYGPLRLFIRKGAGWPYYARPVTPDVEVGPEQVRSVLARMSELGVPQEFEWIHDLTPSLTTAARQAGLAVTLCPMMTLDPDAAASPARGELDGVQIAVIDPDDLDDLDDPDDKALAAAEAVAHVAFAAGIGTAVGEQGPAARDEMAATADRAQLERLREMLRAGQQVRAVARTAEGPVGVGGYQCAGEVAELVGIATLPSARRRGIGAAVAGVLAREARSRGFGTVFLSAQDEDVARVYEQVGFRRVGTAGLAEPT